MSGGNLKYPEFAVLDEKPHASSQHRQPKTFSTICAIGSIRPAILYQFLSRIASCPPSCPP